MFFPFFSRSFFSSTLSRFDIFKRTENKDGCNSLPAPVSVVRGKFRLIYFLCAITGRCSEMPKRRRRQRRRQRYIQTNALKVNLCIMLAIWTSFIRSELVPVPATDRPMVESATLSASILFFIHNFALCACQRIERAGWMDSRTSNSGVFSPSIAASDFRSEEDVRKEIVKAGRREEAGRNWMEWEPICDEHCHCDRYV